VDVARSVLRLTDPIVPRGETVEGERFPIAPDLPSPG
jgi:hypothetical protein